MQCMAVSAVKATLWVAAEATSRVARKQTCIVLAPATRPCMGVGFGTDPGMAGEGTVGVLLAAPVFKLAVSSCCINS